MAMSAMAPAPFGDLLSRLGAEAQRLHVKSQALASRNDQLMAVLSRIREDPLLPMHLREDLSAYTFHPSEQPQRPSPLTSLPSAELQVCGILPTLPGSTLQQEQEQPTKPSQFNGDSGKKSSDMDAKKFKRRSRTGAFGQNTKKLSIIEKPDMATIRERVFLHAFVTSTWFDLFSTVLTFASAIANACEMQYKGFDLGKEVGFPASERSASEIWPGFADGAFVLDILLGICFCSELVLKMGVLQMDFFKSKWNLLDFITVCGWLVETSVASADGNLITLRLLRLIKLGRLARCIRTIQALDSLQVLIGSIVASMSVLAWAASFLLIVHVIAALFLNGLLRDFMMENTNDLTQRQQVYQHFGTFTRSMLTTFELTLGNFGPPTRLLMENVNEWFALLMVIYKLVVGFAFVTVIRGVFMHETFKVAQSDDDLMVVQKTRNIQNHSKQMQKLMKIADENNDGIVTLDEFKLIMANKQMRTWLAALEVDAGDPEGLFALIDSGNDGSLTYDEIASSLSRLKGSARSIDLIALRHDTLNMEWMLHDLMEKVGGLELYQKQALDSS